MKICCRCRVEKPTIDFGRRGDKCLGRCKECEAIRAREKRARYYTVAREREKDWVKRNPEKISASNKRYRKKHATKIRENNKAYREANPNKERMWKRKWRVSNPHKVRAIQARSSAKRYYTIKTVDDGTINADVVASIYDAETCHHCFQYTEPSQRTMDHLMPIAKGGMHSAFNVVMSCNSCNCSKGAKCLPN